MKIPTDLYFNFLLFVSFLTACSMPYKSSTIDPPNSTFSGIESLLEENGEAVLVTIHGMCHHDVKWFTESRDRIAFNSGLDVGPVVPVGEVKKNSALLYRTDLSRDRQRLRMYGIVYSNINLMEKRRALCRDVNKPTAVCPKSILSYNRKRASLNDRLKNQLLNDCFADAVAYLGPTGDHVRKGVRTALFAIIEDIRKDESLSQAPLVFLSESLGSKVLGDSLLCVSKDTLSNTLSDLSRTSHVFLGANQIPLLNLGYIEERCEVESVLEEMEKSGIPIALGGIAGFLDILEATRRLKMDDEQPQLKELNELVIVAFTDPNDLLSYEVIPHDIGGRPVVNVLVSNDLTYFQWIENPIKAHTGYRDNPSVIEWLRCGRSINGKPACK